MQIERIKNTKRNIVFGFINKIVLMLLPFFIRTIILYKFGSEYLGLNSLFSSILQVLNLSELGFSSAIVYSLYKPIAQNDGDIICALMSYYKRMYRKIGIFIGVVGVMLLPFLPHLIKGNCPAGINIYMLYLIFLVNTIISYLFFAYKSALLNAHQRVDVISNIATVTQGSMAFMQILLILLTSNYYLYILMMPIFTLINNIITSYVVDRKYPNYVCRGKLPKEYVANIKKQVSGLMVSKICQTTRNSFDSIILSASLGLIITAIYSNYYYIMTSIIAVMTVIYDAMLAGVGNSIVMESREKNYADLKKFNYIYMWIAGWCTICLACLYQPFMEIWAGREMMFDYSVVVLFCTYFYVLKMGDIRSVYSAASGLWWENRIRAICEAATNLILNIILVQIWGVHGVIIATLLSLLIINFGFGSQLVFKHYFKNGKLGEYFWLHAKYAVVTFFVAYITYCICNFFMINGVTRIMVNGIICCIVPNLLYYFIYCKSQAYKDSIPWLRAILKRKSGDCRK